MPADTPDHMDGTSAAPRPVSPGLHLVATPIGAARDITLRALDIFAGADVLAAEDTRSLRRLLEMHGIALRGREVLAYHDHNGAVMRPRLMAALAEGRSVAYASEAGTPMVADPGYQLVRAAIAQGSAVLAAPGPSAVLAALTVSGLPSDRFCFMGFPPAQGGARRKFLLEAAAIPATLVFYESPRRINRLLGELADALGHEREAALCRELTKRFEEVLRGSLGELAERLAGVELRGEVVVLVDRGQPQKASAADLETSLRDALAGGARVKEAAAQVAAELGLPKRDVYQTALRITADTQEE